MAGLGNVYRKDDGVGPAVADHVRRIVHGLTVIGPLFSPFDLIGLWAGSDLAVVIDAMSSGSPPGTIRLVELDSPRTVADEGPSQLGRTSTHGIGVTGVYRLSRATAQAPGRVVVVGVEGSDFGHGVGLTPAVAGAVEETASIVATLLA